MSMTTSIKNVTLNISSNYAIIIKLIYIIYLFTCLLNSPKVNYKVSGSTRRKQTKYIQTNKTQKGHLYLVDKNNNSIS
jgi:hypothetical protein